MYGQEHGKEYWQEQRLLFFFLLFCYFFSSFDTTTFSFRGIGHRSCVLLTWLWSCGPYAISYLRWDPILFVGRQHQETMFGLRFVHAVEYEVVLEPIDAFSSALAKLCPVHSFSNFPSLCAFSLFYILRSLQLDTVTIPFCPLSIANHPKMIVVSEKRR